MATGNSYLLAVVAVVHRPPSAHHLIIGRVSVGGIAAGAPGLVSANEVDQVDAGLEVAVGREVLVVRRRGDVVGKGQAVEVVLEVDVEQTLVGTVKGDAAVRHGDQGVVVAVVGRQGHDTRVEDVGPANVGRGRKGVWEVEELVRSAIGDDVGVDVDNARELRLLPQVDLCEGRVQIGTVHQVQVGGLVIADSRHRQDIVVDGLISPAHKRLASCCFCVSYLTERTLS